MNSINNELGNCFVEYLNFSVNGEKLKLINYTRISPDE